MTTPPLYTDDDLRSEAAICLLALSTTPGVVDVRRWLPGAYVVSHREDDGSGHTWGDLFDENGLGEVSGKVHALIEGAADVTRWAVELGADGLEPDEHRFTLSAGEKPIIRVHFGFAPGLSDIARDAFVQGLGAAAAREMNLALEENPAPTIPTEVAAHVLWTERKGGWPPSTFAEKLLNLWTSADTANAERLADAFPEYAAAIALLRSGEQGVQELRAIAEDD